MINSTFEQYVEVYKMLEDEESRDIYLNRLNWLISGEPKYMDEIVSSYIPAFGGTRIENLRARVLGNHKTVLYGAGADGKRFIEFYQHYKREGEIIGFCDQDPQKLEYCGYPVMSQDDLLAQREFNVLICSWKYGQEIRTELLRKGYPEDRIFDMYSFQKYDAKQYFSPNFMQYEESETFVDAGSFDLSTSIQLKNYCKNVKKVYVFEPDLMCYEKCIQVKERCGFTQAEILPFGLWSTRTKLRFSETNDQNSHVCEDGGVSIETITLDEAVDAADKVTMIKMDIEGAELEALKGAKKTIQRDKPKLAICIYHKPEDMTQIPLYIKELVPEYKLYIRHHSNDASETVLYAIMN